MKYILSLDQGTTSTKAILFDSNFHIVSSNFIEHKQIYPKPGWVEHDPIEIWENTLKVARQTLDDSISKNIKVGDIKGIGIANQGETVMLWNKLTGKPVYNAIVWQCRRTADITEELKKDIHFENMVKEKTGLLLDAYFSATKIKWIIDNIEGVEEEIQKGNILAGTLDTWLIWNLTGGEKFVTDVTTASRTMLMDIYKLEWNKEILEKLGIPISILPEIRSTSGIFGVTKKECFHNLEIPIAGSVVDQQGALFGQGCFDEGMVKNTYGTGCFMQMNIGEKPIISKNGILTTVAWKIGNDIKYAFDGGVYIAGAAIQWLRDGLNLIENYDDINKMAESVEDNGGVYFVTAFVGLAAPYWDQYARGTIIGITGATQKAHICRATLESIAFQVKNVCDSMEADYGKKIRMLRVDGGITKSDFLMQFQSNILEIPVELPENSESTALGAACFAGLATGVWKDLDDLKRNLKVRKTFMPIMETSKIDAYMNKWDEAVKRSMNWENK